MRTLAELIRHRTPYCSASWRSASPAAAAPMEGVSPSRRARHRAQLSLSSQARAQPSPTSRASTSSAPASTPTKARLVFSSCSRRPEARVSRGPVGSARRFSRSTRPRTCASTPSGRRYSLRTSDRLGTRTSSPILESRVSGIKTSRSAGGWPRATSSVSTRSDPSSTTLSSSSGRRPGGSRLHPAFVPWAFPARRPSLRRPSNRCSPPAKQPRQLRTRADTRPRPPSPARPPSFGFSARPRLRSSAARRCAVRPRRHPPAALVPVRREAAPLEGRGLAAEARPHHRFPSRAALAVPGGRAAEDPTHHAIWHVAILIRSQTQFHCAADERPDDRFGHGCDDGKPDEISRYAWRYARGRTNRTLRRNASLNPAKSPTV